MKITFKPVMGTRCELLKHKDIEIELLEKHIKISCCYLLNKPKNVDDEYSQIINQLMEYECFMLKSIITSIWWIWDSVDKCYCVEIRELNGGHAYNCESKESAIGIYNKLMAWWLA